MGPTFVARARPTGTRPVDRSLLTRHDKMRAAWFELPSRRASYVSNSADLTFGRRSGRALATSRHGCRREDATTREASGRFDVQCAGRFGSAPRDRRSTDPETGVASGLPEAAICVQDIDVQCVLQFTLVNAAGCALHRHTSRVIHRLEWYVRYHHRR